MIWKVTIAGHEAAIAKLRELAGKTKNEIQLLYLPTSAEINRRLRFTLVERIAPAGIPSFHQKLLNVEPRVWTASLALAGDPGCHLHFHSWCFRQGDSLFGTGISKNIVGHRAHCEHVSRCIVVREYEFE